MKKYIIALTFLLLSVSAFAEDIFKNEFEQNIAIRVSQFELVDPHLFVLVFGLICTDITSQVNDQFQAAITNDDDGDGYLDSSIITQFSTDQPAYITSRDLTANFIEANCPDPLHSAACETIITQQNNIPTTFNDTNTCLESVAGTTSAYSPLPNDAIAPCYSTSAITTTINLAGVDVDFQAYQQASRYPGVLSLDNGLRMGFISETDAQNTVFPAEIPGVGGETLASLLPGGLGNCSAGDDRDLFTDGITSGWWFYFNTTSELVELY
ncbi:MAG: hypothetical protein L3J52_04600 [Proteobacteria bacterium]|nr:hypothetical protein [Pseudomonadota bacterium]